MEEILISDTFDHVACFKEAFVVESALCHLFVAYIAVLKVSKGSEYSEAANVGVLTA